MGERYLEDYMKRMGWGSGFNVPVANDENRDLEKQLETIQRKVVEIRSALHDEQRSVEDLKKHASRSSVLTSNMGKMAQTQCASLEHARNLNVAGESSLKSFKRDLKRHRAELENEQRRHGKIRSDLENRQETVNQLSREIKWDQTAIETLRNSSKDEETDVELMAQYFQLDENTIKQGEVAHAKMKITGDKLRTLLESELSQTKSSELMLHRLCNQFREAHKSRNEAVDLWKGVIESLKFRDTDLETLGQLYVDRKRDIRTLGECIREHESLLKTSEQNTAELTHQLRAFEKSSSYFRERISTNQANIKLYVSQLTQTRLEVKSTAVELRKVERRKSSSQDELQNIGSKEEELKNEVEAIRFEHKKFKYGSSSTDEKFRQLEQILDTEEEKLGNQEKEAEKLRLFLVQSTNEITKLRKLFESLQLDIKGKKNQFLETVRVTNANDFQIEQNKRVWHDLDTKVLSLNGRIGKHLFEIDQLDGNPVQFLNKLKKLREELKNSHHEKAKQENLKGFTESIIQRLKKEITQFLEEGEAIDTANANLRILIATYKKDDFGGMTSLREAKFNFQMILITRNRLMDTMNRRKQRCYSASKQFLEMKTIVGERRSEIDTHLKLLDQRRKTLADGKGRLLMNMKDMQAYLRHWKTKYEFVMTSMTSEDGSSEAFLIVKFAQERECLKQEGELWDHRVKEAEKEIEGLQNTLALLSNANQNFKTSLAPPWRKSAITTKATMTEKLYNDFQILKQRSQRRLAVLLKNADEKKAELFQIQGGIQLMRQTLLDRREELNVAYQEITGQKVKIDRASLLTRRLMRQMEEIGAEELESIETEIKLKCLREKYEFSTKTIKKTIETFPKLQPWILNYLKSNSLLSKTAEKLEKQQSVESFSGKKTPEKSVSSFSQTSLPTQQEKIKDQHMRSTTTHPPLKHHLVPLSHHPFAPLLKQSVAKKGTKLSAFEDSTSDQSQQPTRPKSILRRGQSSQI